MAKRQYPWWIKHRDNYQNVYYVAMGQMSKTAAEKYEHPIHGMNTMLRFDTEAEYQSKLEELRANGENVQ